MAEIEFEKRPMPAEMLWPQDRRIALVFNLAWEMWSPGATSGVGPMGNLLADGIFDPNADSYGRYNSTYGIPRRVSILERRGVPATLMISALVAAERAIARCTEAIEAATGTRPAGWISPRGTSSAAVQRRLAWYGYFWHGDVLDADMPYLPRFDDAEILAILMAVEFNDLPHAMRFGRTPRQFVGMFRDALAEVKSQPAETLILDVFAHGHCYGRPAATWAIDEITAHRRKAGRQAE